nr:PTS system fructose-specific IIB component/PTS system fructose-specific IIC component [uncultured bacterium]
MALANMLVQFGLPYTDMSKGAPSFTWVVESIGYLGFTFMIPIMGAYIASSIADKPAFAPAFLVCYLANDKALLGTQSGAGIPRRGRCCGWRLAISSSGSAKCALAKHYNRCSVQC